MEVEFLAPLQRGDEELVLVIVPPEDLGGLDLAVRLVGIPPGALVGCLIDRPRRDNRRSSMTRIAVRPRSRRSAEARLVQRLVARGYRDVASYVVWAPAGRARLWCQAEDRAALRWAQRTGLLVSRRGLVGAASRSVLALPVLRHLGTRRLVVGWSSVERSRS